MGIQKKKRKKKKKKGIQTKINQCETMNIPQI